jgi:hypothetical protein
LGKLPYGERKALVIAAINALGPTPAHEQPNPGDHEFARRVARWRAEHDVTFEHAVLHEILAERAQPCAEVQRLLAARDAGELAGDDSANGRWLARLGRMLLG